MKSPFVAEIEGDFYPWDKTKKGWGQFLKAKQAWDLYHQAMEDPNAAASTVLEMCTGKIMNAQTHLDAEKFLSPACMPRHRGMQRRVARTVRAAPVRLSSVMPAIE